MGTTKDITVKEQDAKALNALSKSAAKHNAKLEYMRAERIGKIRKALEDSRFADVYYVAVTNRQRAHNTLSRGSGKGQKQREIDYQRAEVRQLTLEHAARLFLDRPDSTDRLIGQEVLQALSASVEARRQDSDLAEAARMFTVRNSMF